MALIPLIYKLLPEVIMLVQLRMLRYHSPLEEAFPQNRSKCSSVILFPQDEWLTIYC